MTTLAICALLVVGAVLFAVAVLRLAWIGLLYAWRAFLHVAGAIVARISRRDISLNFLAILACLTLTIVI